MRKVEAFARLGLWPSGSVWWSWLSADTFVAVLVSSLIQKLPKDIHVNTRSCKVYVLVTY